MCCTLNSPNPVTFTFKKVSKKKKIQHSFHLISYLDKCDVTLHGLPTSTSAILSVLSTGRVFPDSFSDPNWTFLVDTPSQGTLPVIVGCFVLCLKYSFQYSSSSHFIQISAQKSSETAKIITYLCPYFFIVFIITSYIIILYIIWLPAYVSLPSLESKLPGGRGSAVFRSSCCRVQRSSCMEYIFLKHLLIQQMTSTHLLNLSTVDFAESWICNGTGKEKTLVRILAHLLSGSWASLRSECTWALKVMGMKKKKKKTEPWNQTQWMFGHEHI